MSRDPFRAATLILQESYTLHENLEWDRLARLADEALDAFQSDTAAVAVRADAVDHDRQSFVDFMDSRKLPDDWQECKSYPLDLGAIIADVWINGDDHDRARIDHDHKIAAQRDAMMMANPSLQYSFKMPRDDLDDQDDLDD